jgi:integrase
MRLEDVTTQVLECWRATLTSSNRTVAKHLVILHGIFREAMKLWGLPTNPTATVERPRYRVSDDLEAYSPEEVWALVRAAGEQDATLYLAAAFTGLQMGALLALQWRDIDCNGEAIRVRRSYNVHGGIGSPKSGEFAARRWSPTSPRRSRDSPTASSGIEPEDLVFANELGTFQDASAIRIRYRAALTRARLRQLRFHDLRHTFGTLAVRRAEVPAVQAWMGHSDIQTTMRYVHHRDRGEKPSSWPKRPTLSSAQVTWARPASCRLPARADGQHRGAYMCVTLRRERDARRE